MATNIFINEFHYDNSGTDVGEAIEILGPAGTDLTGWSIVLYNGNGGTVYDTRSLSGIIPDQEDGFGTISVSYPTNGIQNGSPDGIALVDNNSNVIQFLSYEGTFTAVDGPAAGLSSTNIGVAETSSTPAGFSLQLVGTGTTYEDFTWQDPADDSFGDVNSGQSFSGGGTDPEPTPEPDVTRIYDIQGAGHISAFEGQTVITTGIVTAVDSNGFYLQDPMGDSQDDTSDGIFVFTRNRPSVTVGDELQVEGTVSEFIPGGADTDNLSITQISSPTVATLSTGNALPTATLLGAGGRVPPTQIIDNDNFSPYDPAQDGIDFYESLEGMRVTVNDALAVSPTNRFGEIFTVADNGESATGLSDRGTINIAPDDFNPERIQIQFDSGILPDFEQQVNVGAQLGDVTGVVSYAFGNFEVAVTEAFTPVQQSSLQPEVSSLAGTEDQLTVASYNVLNLDPNDEDGSQDIANGQFDQIASQIVNNLNSPDIIGLQEIQDSDGSVKSDITSAEVTLQTLVDAIAAAGGPRYEFIDNPFIGDDTNGGQPGGNIRNAFLYNPDRVSFTGELEAVTDPAAQQTDPSNPFYDSRLPLAATFLFNGQEVTVVDNHFTSKGGSAPLFGQLQPSVDPNDPKGGQEDPAINGGVEVRRAQAEAVNDYVEGVLAEDPNANVAVLGDLNEFEFISPLEILEGNELNNLTETLPENERYSYIFQGNSQSLDHILVTDSLFSGVEFDPVHVNSEFADQASDHDPLLSRLNLPVPEGAITGTSQADTLTGNSKSDAIFGRQGDDTLSGGQSDDLLYGGSGDDLLKGHQGDDALCGESGDDRLMGNQGNDLLDGGTGNDRLSGDNGADVLLGKAGADFLSGGNGDDLLNGGLGDNILDGGLGSDRFVLSTGAGTDTILDFTAGLDLLQLQGLTFEQLTIGQGVGNNQADTLISFNRNGSTELLAILSGVQAEIIVGSNFVVA